MWHADADLAIEWGAGRGDEFNIDSPPWPGRNTSCDLDILWRGQVLFREMVLVVDGGRCYLPLPSTVFCSPDRVARARLLDDMAHGHITMDGLSNFDHYWQWWGLLV